MMNLKLPLLLCCASLILDSASATMPENKVQVPNKSWSRVESLIKDNVGISVDVLQEVEFTPTSSEKQHDLGDRLINPNHVQFAVQELKWEIDNTVTGWVYYARNDSGDNVMIMTKEKADKVILLEAPRAAIATPILGAKLGSEYYFTISARSNSEIGDVGSIVRMVANYFEDQKEYSHQTKITINYKIKKNRHRYSFRQCHDLRKSIEVYYSNVADK